MSEPSPNRDHVGAAATGHAAPIIAALVTLCVVLVVSIVCHRPPPPRPVSAPETAFSAERALQWLDLMLAESIPHPVESEANAVVRDRILALLRSWGYAPVVQVASVDRWDGPVTVHNILARRNGSSDGPAVMLATHYDSVDEGPGAADDGAGVAAQLEIARMLGEEPPPGRDVIFLITDGEEAGLLGARAFCESPHPWLTDVGVVVNLEARGTSGPSIMFETSDGAGWLVRAYGSAVQRPVTGSLYFEVYRRMPNDTDLTIFKEHGLPGCNFAFIGSPRNYHTADDDIEHLDLGSMQHHGDNALSLVRALVDPGFELDRADAAGEDLVYFDVLGRAFLWWTQPVGIGASAVSLGLLLLTAWMLRRRGVTFAAMLRAAGTAVLTIVTTIVAGALVHLVLRALGAIPTQWIDRPVLVLTPIWMVGVATPALLAGASGRAVWAAWAAVWIGWAAAAMVVATTVAGASYLLLAPAGIAAIAGPMVAVATRRFPRTAMTVAAITTTAAAGLLWLPLELSLYDALGVESGAVLAARPALLATILLPWLAAAPVQTRTVIGVAAIVIAAISATLSVLF